MFSIPVQGPMVLSPTEEAKWLQDVAKQPRFAFVRQHKVTKYREFIAAANARAAGLRGLEQAVPAIQDTSEPADARVWIMTEEELFPTTEGSYTCNMFWAPNLEDPQAPVGLHRSECGYNWWLIFGTTREEALSELESDTTSNNCKCIRMGVDPNDVIRRCRV